MSGEMATEIDQNIDHTVGDLDDCPGKTRGNPKWLPFKLSSYSKDGNYTWIDDRPSSNGSEIILQNWQTSQPNSLGHVDCVQAKKFEAKVLLDDTDCTRTICSICSTPAIQNFYLRGNIKRVDHKYLLSWEMQNLKTEVTFEGQQGSNKIVWKPSQRKTELRKYTDEATKEGKEQTIYTFEQPPFGRLESNKSNNALLIFTNVSLVFILQSLELPHQIPIPQIGLNRNNQTTL